MASPVPIRVGLIGLSSHEGGKLEGVSWAEIAHLPYIRKTPHYEVRALLNSSVEAAQQAVRKYGLAETTRVYSDPNDLANDNEIDLVICCVRVDQHFPTVKPSLIAGKAVYVEWPLGPNLTIAKEMQSLAVQHHAKTIIGLQASFSPFIRKIQTVRESNVLGRLLSSSIVGSLEFGGATESSKTRFFLDREIGGNLMSIHGGHSLEYVNTALGEIQPLKSNCAIRRPFKDIVDPISGETITKNVPNTVPDHLLMYGVAHPSNAVVVINLTGGRGIPGLPILDWRIQFENGWLRLQSSTIALNVGSPDTKLEIFDAARGTQEEVHPDEDEWSGMPVPAQNIARLYEAYRLGQWYPDFEYALKRHGMVESMWNDFDENSFGS